MKKFIENHISTLPQALSDDEFTGTQTVILTLAAFILAGILIGICGALLAPLQQ